MGVRNKLLEVAPCKDLSPARLRANQDFHIWLKHTDLAIGPGGAPNMSLVNDLGCKAFSEDDPAFTEDRMNHWCGLSHRQLLINATVAAREHVTLRRFCPVVCKCGADGRWTP